MERHLAGPWERLVQGRSRLLDRVEARDQEFREWRPSPTAWSFADVVEHLELVETHMLSALAKEPDPGRPRRWSRWRRLRWIGLRVALKTGVRITAPTEIILPTRQLQWHALLARWEEQRRAFEEWLRASDPRIHPRPRFKHPIVGWLNVPEAVTFAADHLEHHLQQIARIERAFRRGPG